MTSFEEETGASPAKTAKAGKTNAIAKAITFFIYPFPGSLESRLGIRKRKILSEMYKV
jgi:hypothetical protein